MMPDIDGLEICHRIRADERTRNLPVLILTAKDSLSEKMKGFKAGGDDYLTKPFAIGELLARIRAHLRIRELNKNFALAEERYRILTENLADGIILLSPTFELLYHNSRFLDIAKGRTVEPLTGRILQELFPLSDLFQEISRLLDDVTKDSQSHTRDVQISASNHGTIHLEIAALPIKNEFHQIEMFQVVIRDVTQRRKMEEALIQAEKINSLGILTAGIAHEVNNPLTGISNAIQILQKGEVGRRRQVEICDLILTHINRIANIVKDLRIFACPQGVTPEIFTLHDVITETIALARYQSEQNLIEFEWTAPPGPPLSLFGDRNQFQQVLINLVVNAIEAIQKRGKISIVLERKDTSAVIMVEDTGSGIPAHQLSRIFDPFFTTKRNWKGTGLGLAVSFRIIQLFKGSITVQSTVGKGSRFTVSVPLYQESSRVKPVPKEPETPHTN